MLRIDHLRDRPLYTIVENRTLYGFPSMELNLFETYEPCRVQGIRFEHSILASMVRGRKTVDLRDQPSFAFLPGESILLPGNEVMDLDLPDATERSPIKCLALEIDGREFQLAAQLLNETRRRTDGEEWAPSTDPFHFVQRPEINHLLQRLTYLCTENHPSKELFVSMLLRELLVRLLDAESKSRSLLEAELNATQYPLSAVITYIRKNLDHKLSVKQLSKLAYMSESAFYQAFRTELGRTPVEFINDERMALAAHLLLDPRQNIREVAMRCGFNSVSYFCRIFREHHGTSPGAYQLERAYPANPQSLSA
ncbi:helix-turn-helix domain-containing protein [Neolewinella sp.]|uniref:helix-turn-helix transcriptional regulator n=1 Tax=Neolewinella sp. TaxID=2993543 RepID=UPI003B51D79F